MALKRWGMFTFMAAFLGMAALDGILSCPDLQHPSW